jgi:hypothetical protein
MFNEINNFEKLETRRGLYCVWIRAHEGQHAPLVAIWIDPAMTAFTPPAHDGLVHSIEVQVVTAQKPAANASGSP